MKKIKPTTSIKKFKTYITNENKITKHKASKKVCSSIKRKKKFTKIQKEIVDYVTQDNNSILNYSLNQLKHTDKIFKISFEVKKFCLAKISDEFGSAVCINEKGFILTCAHAAAPIDNSLTITNHFYYIFANGEQVIAETIGLDEDLDLALLRVIEVKINGRFKKLEEFKNKKFPYAKLKQNANLIKNPDKDENVFCIGNPCFAEFENGCGNAYNKNEYKPFWLSKGKIKGYMKDEVYGKFDLGPMIHTCWTYWGHSGAPIFNYNSELVGMHNSWNDKNANRHGISLIGIYQFLSKFDYLRN
jgi:hypothetical protein